MAVIQQTVPHLLYGVSQKAPHLRDPSFVGDLSNGILHPDIGLSRRPATRHVAQLASSPSGFAGASLHSVVVSDTQRYLIVAANGLLKVFDTATGAEQTVVLNAGTSSYLTTSGEPNTFQFVTIGANTYLVNRSIATRKGTSVAAARSAEALLYVRAGDYSTTFSVRINDVVTNIATSVGTSATMRRDIATDVIATSLLAELQRSSLTSSFTFTRLGSSIYVKRIDGKDFTISATDGLADTGLIALKDTAKTLEDLPPTIPVEAEGYTVRILGSPSTDADDFFVSYTNGAWRECAKPGVLNSLDASTMPHLITQGGTLLDGLTTDGAPPAPAISDLSAALLSLGWTSVVTPRTTTPIGTGAAGLLRRSGDYAVKTVNEFDGYAATLVFYFDIDAAALPSGMTGSLDFEYWTGSAWSNLVSFAINPGDVASDRSATVTTTKARGTQIRAKVTYSGGTIPAYAINELSVVLHAGTDAAKPGILMSSSGATLVQFEGARLYPPGLVVTTTVSGTPVAVTVGSTGALGTALATAVKDAIVAAAITNRTATLSGDAGVTVRDTAASPAPVVTITLPFNEATTLFHVAGGMTASAHVGATVQNVTDGSSGTITANTVSTISVSSLTGGGANSFRKGDKIRIVGSSSTWVLSRPTWDVRAAGDDTTNPFPSFVNQPIRSIFVFQNRLGLVARDAFVLSSSRTFLNYFRTTVRDLLDSDVVDVTGRSSAGAPFRHAFSWNGGLYLSTEKAQYEIPGDVVVTAKTVRLNLVSSFSTSALASPVVSGNRAFLSRTQTGATQVHDLFVRPNSDNVGGKDVTSHVPSFLTGSPVLLAADGSNGFLAVMTTAGLYVGNVFDNENGSTVAWHRWTFAAGSTLLGMLAENGLIYFVISRTNGVSLERCDLLSPFFEFVSATLPWTAYCLDRGLTLNTGTTGSGYTEWTLPYPVATDSSQGEVVVCRLDTGAELVVTRPSTTLVRTADAALGSTPVVIGIRTSFSVDLTRLYYRRAKRDGTMDVDTRARLALHDVLLVLDHTRAMSATVRRTGYADYTATFSGSSADTAQKFRVQVSADASTVSITFGTTSPYPARVASYEWEGLYNPRAARL